MEKQPIIHRNLILVQLDLQDLPLQDAPLLLLALYEKVTLSRACPLPSSQLLPNV